MERRQELEELPRKKKSGSKNSRRFSDEQIRLMEGIFESETRIEPRKKLQLARELGLQPRQVAIWFQNRRARWKSKQIEHDYKALRGDYDELASRFESLRNENQSLVQQLQKLNELLEKHREKNCCRSKNREENKMDGTDRNGRTTKEREGNVTNVLHEVVDHDEFINSPSYTAKDLKFDPGEGCETLKRARSEDDTEGLFDDQPCNILPWLDFWS